MASLCSLRRPCVRVIAKKVLSLIAVEKTFGRAVKRAGLPLGPGGVWPRPRSLRHAFAVRALQICPDGSDLITKHMLALSTYLGHGKVARTYWYLEAVPDLMRDIADRAEQFAMGGRA